MRKLSVVIACMVLPFLVNAQTISDKEVKSGGFSQGKFKNAPKKVYINSFQIFFEVFGSADASTTGGESFGRVHSSTKTVMGVALEGVESEDFMMVTNNAYQYFIEDLKSKGFELVSADEAGKTSLYKDWIRKQGGELSSSESAGFVRATPAGYEYFVPGEKKSGKERTTVFDRSPALSQELGDAIIVDVALSFDFIDMKVFRSELLNVSNVKGKVNFKVSTAPGPSMVVSTVNFSYGKTFTAATAAIQNTLKSDIAIESKVFQDEKFSETTTSKATNVPSWAGLVWVTTDVNSNASHIATCNGELYKKETERLTKEFLTVGLTNFYKSAGIK